MKKIIFRRKVKNRISQYTKNYKLYHFELYKDSGIWAENQIINSYIIEADKRYKEIFDTIETYFQNDFLHFSNNKTFIPWRKKSLKITFSETKNTRIIEDLEIQ